MIALVGIRITEEQIYTYGNVEERDSHLEEMKLKICIQKKWNCKDGLTCSFIFDNTTYVDDPNGMTRDLL